jgi:hypothetical protein
VRRADIGGIHPAKLHRGLRRQLVPVISGVPVIFGMIATEPHGKPWFLPVMLNWCKLKDRLTGTIK